MYLPLWADLLNKGQRGGKPTQQTGVYTVSRINRGSGGMLVEERVVYDRVRLCRHGALLTGNGTFRDDAGDGSECRGPGGTRGSESRICLELGKSGRSRLGRGVSVERLDTDQEAGRVPYRSTITRVVVGQYFATRSSSMELEQWEWGSSAASSQG